MPFDEKIFCQRLQEISLTFKDMSAQLVALYRESNGKAVIHANTQAVIYESLPDLLPGFAGAATAQDWRLITPPLTLHNWLIGMSLFAPGNQREKLLQDTAILLKRLPRPELGDNVTLRKAVFTLRNMENSAGVREMLQEITRQLTGCAVGWVVPATISETLLCLQNQPDSDVVRAVLNALLLHLAYAGERKIWFSTEEIGNALSGLQRLSTMPEVNRILDRLVPHILARKEQRKLMNNTQLAMAFYGLHNMQLSAEVARVLEVLHAHLDSQVVEMDTFCKVLCGLRNMACCAEVETMLLSVIPRLQAYINAGSFFSSGQLDLILTSLMRLAPLPSAIIIYRLLIPQVFAAALTLSASALGSAFLLLAYLPDCTETQQCINALLARIQMRLRNGRRRMTPLAISSILRNLCRLPASSAVINPMLVLLRKHLEQNAQDRVWMPNRFIANALYGLQYLPVSPDIEAIIAALALHIHPVHSVIRGSPLEKMRRLAQMIYSLRQHFLPRYEATTAKHLIQTMARIHELELDVEQLHGSTLIDQIMRLGEYLSQVNGQALLDISLCTLPLAQALCENVLARHLQVGTTSLAIVFGQEGTLSVAERYWQGKRQELLQTMLIGKTCHWETGQVTVQISDGVQGEKRSSPALPQTGQAAFAAQPARKRIKTEPVSSPVTQPGVNTEEEIDVEEETDAEEEAEAV